MHAHTHAQVRAIMLGQVPLESIPEPLRGQISLVINPAQSPPARALGYTTAEQMMAAVVSAATQQQVCVCVRERAHAQCFIM